MDQKSIEGSNPSLSAKSFFLASSVLWSCPKKEEEVVQAASAARYNLGYNQVYCAPVAQLDRVQRYERWGREFESLRARHQIGKPPSRRLFRLETVTRPDSNAGGGRLELAPCPGILPRSPRALPRAANGSHLPCLHGQSFVRRAIRPISACGRRVQSATMNHASAPES